MPYSLLLALGIALGQDTTQPPVFAVAALQAADSIAAAEFAKDSLGSITGDAVCSGTVNDGEFQGDCSLAAENIRGAVSMATVHTGPA